MPPSRSSTRARRSGGGSRTSGKTSPTFSRASGKTSAYDRNFEQHLIDHNIYPNNRDAKPDNWAEINRRISQPRASLSPSRFSDSAFEKFQKINESALTETKQCLLFNNFKPVTDGGLVDAKPDFYDGTELEKIYPEIRDSLGTMIIPSSLQHARSLPNFFTEAKGPDGSAAVAKRQACYDGALGARAMTSIRQFRQPLLRNHNAVTITSTFHDSTLKLYTTHITDLESKDGPKPFEKVLLF
ncbi:hypothetical protein DL98DRAFT_576354 [Cadophora sp. DSE1049]|nr:hypothetical protein DL98DRAFT_576354 [Cadophora sp. DSE1049]